MTSIGAARTLVIFVMHIIGIEGLVFAPSSTKLLEIGMEVRLARLRPEAE